MKRLNDYKRYTLRVRGMREGREVFVHFPMKYHRYVRRAVLNTNI